VSTVPLSETALPILAILIGDFCNKIDYIAKHNIPIETIGDKTFGSLYETAMKPLPSVSRACRSVAADEGTCAVQSVAAQNECWTRFRV